MKSLAIVVEVEVAEVVEVVEVVGVEVVEVEVAAEAFVAAPPVAGVDDSLMVEASAVLPSEEAPLWSNR